MAHYLFSIFLVVFSFSYLAKAFAVEPNDCSADAEIRISFLKVGQGDSTLITCLRNNHNILIDAGDSSKRHANAEELLKQGLYLRLPGKKIDFAIATHPHSDHIYGFRSLLNAGFEIEEFIDNSSHGELEQLYRAVSQQVHSTGGKTSSVTTGQTRRIELCPGLVVTIQAPDKEISQQLDCPNNYNDCSLQVTTRYNGFSISILSDRTLAWEQIAIKNNQIEKAQVLRTGHHGNLSTSPALLERMQPAFAVISAGENIGVNAKFGYPRWQAIENLNAYFSRHFGDHYHLETSNACRWNSGKCDWINYQAHERILDTRRGSFDLYISDDDFCIQRQ